MAERPTSWFAACLADGTTLTYGMITRDIGENADFLDNFRSIELRGYVDAPRSTGHD
jgi:hypothetical protein